MAIIPWNGMHLFATFLLLFQENRGGERTLPEIQYNFLRSLMGMLCIQNEGTHCIHGFSWHFFHFVGDFLKKKKKARNSTVAVYPIDPKPKLASANMSSVIFAGDYATKYANTFIDLFFMHFLTTMSTLLNLPWLVMPSWPFVFDIWPLNLKSIPTFFVIKWFCKVLFHIARWLQIGIIYHTKQNITHMTR